MATTRKKTRKSTKKTTKRKKTARKTTKRKKTASKTTKRKTTKRRKRAHPKIKNHGKTTAERRHYIEYRDKVDAIKKEFYP